MTPSILAAIINWLRAGYPDGVPEQDYVPLFALLRRRLSPDEVKQVAEKIIRADEEADDIDIGVRITKITNELPSETDVARVRTRLAAAGWPLTDPNQEAN
ncbi:MAG TPA: DUF3349 domain-containing protein [Microlunatus sp.]